MRAELDRLWPILTPQQLLADLYADPDRIASAAPMLTEAERAAAAASRPDGGWTPADVPLLDEAAELLGEDEAAAARRPSGCAGSASSTPRARWTSSSGSQSIDWEDEEAEILTATDVIDAGRLAERYVDEEHLTAGAAGRRRPALGVRAHHRRRGAGTLADGLAAADAALPEPVDDGRRRRRPDRRRWAGRRRGTEVLEPYVADRWRLAELTVNYRTPAEIMELAGGCWPAVDPAARPPRSVRSTGVAPVGRAVPRRRARRPSWSPRCAERCAGSATAGSA